MIMTKPPLPHDESDRILKIKSLDILDSAPEDIFDGITRTAALICNMPIALISIVDDDRQWFKSRHGLNLTQGTREDSFCGHAIHEVGVFQIEDSLTDERFKDNPLVTGPTNIRSYVGVPLHVGAAGSAIGTLCVIDTEPRRLSDTQITALRDLSNLVVKMLEARKQSQLSDKASEAKTAFLANMSHEIRSPLGAIVGFSELLKNKSITSQQHANYVEVIERNSRHLMALIDDILDLSKVEAGKMSIENVDFSLKELVGELGSFMALRAKEKAIGFQINIGSNVPDQIISDPTRLRQILNNVVGNAIKFTSSGHVHLDLEVKQELLIMTVTDTGIGLKPEESAQLFKPFQQADVSTTRKFGGTGLGLVLTRRLAQALGGTLELVSSTPGEGSTFCVSIRYEASAKSHVNPQDDLDRKALTVEQTGSLRGIRVLLIDDSHDNRILVNIYLHMAGATVVTAEDGARGCEIALKTRFDVILCDMQMPNMDGYETTERLRSSGIETPIIAFTAHAMEDEKRKALARGFSDYITKPIKKNDLIDAILQNLRRSKNQSNQY